MQMMELSFVRLENILKKRKNAVYQHFLLFPTRFSVDFFHMVVKTCDYVVKGLTLYKTTKF